MGRNARRRRTSKQQRQRDRQVPLPDSGAAMPWIYRGGPEHARSYHKSSAIATRLNQIDYGLELLAHAINMMAASVNTGFKAVNELSAIACYVRAFRALRAASVLAMEGLYLEARVYVRDVYESAGLGRLLALEPTKADDWLVRERWIKDNEVRQYIENLLMPGVAPSESPYREYYRQAGELHHPTAISCVGLAWDLETDSCVPQLTPRFDEQVMDRVLEEIAIETTYVGWTIWNAAATPDSVPPDWLEALSELSKEVWGPHAKVEHLDRDWDETRRRFQRMRENVVLSDGIDAALDADPNSARNVRRRAEEAANPD